MSTTSALTTEKVAARVQPRFDSIDGLRGFACLMVLLCHSSLHFDNIGWPNSNIGSFSLSQAHLFAYGYGGVDLFFVLSGFCLAYPIVSRSERPVDWKRYAINRARRILPPYWAAMLLFAGLTLLIVHRNVQPFAAQHILGWPGTRQVIYSFLLISDSFNGSFWTLPLEWRWYFVLPLLIWLWRRIGGAAILLGLLPVSLASIFLFMPSHSEQLKFLVSPLFSYIPLFGLGIWAASLAAGRAVYQWEHRIKSFIPIGTAVSFLLMIMFAPTNVPSWEGKYVLLRLLTWGPLCFFLVLAATQEGPIRRFLAWRPLVWVGTFSYSLYLVHEPFLSMAAALILPHHWPVGLVLLLQIVVLPTILVGFGYLFFLVAEKPFLRRPVKKAIEAEQQGVTAKAATEPA